MKHLGAQQLSSSLDGTLTGAELEAVVQHLGACRECRDRHSSFSKQNDALRRLLAFEPSEKQLAESLALVESALHAEVREAIAPAVAAPPPPRVAPAPPPAPARVEFTSAPASGPRRIPWALALAGAAGAAALLIAASLTLRKPATPLATVQPPARSSRAPLKPADSTTATLAPQPAPAVRTASASSVTPTRVRPATPAPPAPLPRPQPPVVAPTTTVVTRTLTPTAPATPAPRPAAPPAESARSDEGAAWPLLCGIVTDSSGAPVAGARVSLADLDLSARTDRRGRFCVAAPPGERTLSVLAQGFASTRRLVSLGAAGLELEITLADRE